MSSAIVVATVVKHAVSTRLDLTKTLTNGGTLGLAIRNILVPANSAVYALAEQGLPINLNEVDKKLGKIRQKVI